MAGADEFARWADIMNKRGHAPEFARVTAEDACIVQKSTAYEWADAMRAKYQLDVTGVASNGLGPPDCIARCNGRLLSLELSELVNPVILSKISRARREGRTISASDELFDEAQWTPELLSQRVNKLLDKKHRRYATKGQVFDVLIIHSAEPWLSPTQVEAWLTKLTFEPRSSFTAAYLLLRYFSGYSKRWPVFNLFGRI